MDATDVLIVGAGPTGLTLAGELLRRGVQCRIIDKAEAPASTSRALGLQPRTLELFDTMGIIDGVLAGGGPVFGANLYDGDHLLVSFDLTGTERLHTPYPHVWLMPQSSVERLLTDRLRELGGEVQRGRELVDAHHGGTGIVATVRAVDDGAERTEEIQARWLVGCDGSHSRVRKLLGLALDGSTYEERFLLADLDVDWNRGRDRTHTWFPAEGMFAVLPLLGTDQWRVLTVLEGEPVPPLSLDLFRRLFRERTGDAATTLANPTWLSSFTIHQRMVDRYRVGNSFVAGDAAHIHSPFGGQGLNTGIQDAFNLAWKLALVVGGQAPERLLDTYEAERLPVARRVLDQTNANTKALLSHNPVMAFVREQILTLDAVEGYLARRGSQLLVNYRDSPLSAEPAPSLFAPDGAGERPGVRGRVAFLAAPRPGDRAPDGPVVRAGGGEATSLLREFRGTHFSLLLFDGAAGSAAGYANLARIAARSRELLGEEVRAHLIVMGEEGARAEPWDGSTLLDPSGELHRRYGARSEALYLIRPDGYVGFRSQPADLDALVAYLTDRFLAGSPSASGGGVSAAVASPASDDRLHDGAASVAARAISGGAAAGGPASGRARVAWGDQPVAPPR